MKTKTLKITTSEFVETKDGGILNIIREKRHFQTKRGDTVISVYIVDFLPILNVENGVNIRGTIVILNNPVRRLR